MKKDEFIASCRASGFELTAKSYVKDKPKEYDYGFDDLRIVMEEKPVIGSGDRWGHFSDGAVGSAKTTKQFKF